MFGQIKIKKKIRLKALVIENWSKKSFLILILILDSVAPSVLNNFSAATHVDLELSCTWLVNYPARAWRKWKEPVADAQAGVGPPAPTPRWRVSPAPEPNTPVVRAAGQ